jgi:hypothetical protein
MWSYWGLSWTLALSLALCAPKLVLLQRQAGRSSASAAVSAARLRIADPIFQLAALMRRQEPNNLTSSGDTLSRAKLAGNTRSATRDLRIGVIHRRERSKGNPAPCWGRGAGLGSHQPEKLRLSVRPTMVHRW